MGADHARVAVALQALLMHGVREFGEAAGPAAVSARALAGAASLDYVLMLATGSAGARVPPDESRRAVHDGIAQAVDDGFALVRAIVELGDAGAVAFARAALPVLREAIALEELATDDRRFALIAIAADLTRS